MKEDYQFYITLFAILTSTIISLVSVFIAQRNQKKMQEKKHEYRLRLQEFQFVEELRDQKRKDIYNKLTKLYAPLLVYRKVVSNYMIFLRMVKSLERLQNLPTE
ncbi:hypothetical protein [Labilibacter marinus]|uniref:hypothetical protein n=1 Tax=Labilibacter marinus TaxID=1477105 RepID=UPI00094F896B|nr:hypothetical protein [Labilibacter marinus]